MDAVKDNAAHHPRVAGIEGSIRSAIERRVQDDASLVAHLEALRRAESARARPSGPRGQRG